MLAVPVVGLSWPKATANAALVTAIPSIPLSAAMKWALPAVPFLNRMGYVFLVSVALIAAVSYLEGRGRDSPRAVRVEGLVAGRGPSFLMAAFGVLSVTAAFYALFW